tara:strand:- start:22 stop:2484 length:2463 start_codon:yes stop_codon:yes gene_type:complete
MEGKKKMNKNKNVKLEKTPLLVSTHTNNDLSLNNDKIKNNSNIKNNNIDDIYMDVKNILQQLKERKIKNENDFKTYLADEKLKFVACKLVWDSDKKHFTKPMHLTTMWKKDSNFVTFQFFKQWLIDKKKDYDEIYVDYDIHNTDLACFDFDGLHHTLPYVRDKYDTIGQTETLQGNNKGLHSFFRNPLFKGATKIADGTALDPDKKEPCDFIPDNLWLKPMDYLKLRNKIQDDLIHKIPDDVLKEKFPIIYNKCTSEKKIYVPDNSKISECNNTEVIELVEQCLTDKDADTWKDWSMIIASLKSLDLKEVARNFSKRSEKHTDEEFDKTWENSNILDIGNIYTYAKKGNLKEFNKIKKKYILIENKKKYNRDDDFIDYLQQKTLFEKKHFITLFPKLQFCFENKNENGICDIQTYTSATNFKEYANMFTYKMEIEKKDGTIEVQEKPFYPSWIKDKNRRQYSSMVFKPYPEKVNLNDYNTFKGFNYEKYEPEEDNFAIYQNHLKYLCGNDKTDELFKYMEQWIANIIFRPAQLNKVAIILKSEEKQIGKGLFFRKLFSNILYKDAFLETVKPDDVFGKFANTYKKFVVVLDEAEMKDTFELEAAIKHYITEPVIMTERKGIDKQKVDNYARLMLFTNKTALKIEAGDQRFVAIEHTEPRKTKEYYDNLSKALDNKNQLSGYVKYLSTIFDENYDFQVNRPLTIYYEELQGLSLPIWFRFWFDYLKDVDDTKFSFQSYDFYTNKYCVWMQKRGFKCITIQKYGRDLTKIEGITKKTNSKFAVYWVDVDILLKGFVEKKYISDDICSEIMSRIEEKQSNKID